MPASIIFVDPSVANYQTLLQGVNPDAQVVVLDTERSGIAQITETLAHSQDITEIHLLSHGSPGSLYLGSDILNRENLEKYRSQLQKWGKFLTKNADILLYGCQVAATETGKTFVQWLHQLTGANIAASKYPVGNPKQGGTWNLEYNVGNISSPIAFAPEVCNAYPGIFGASFGTASTFGVGANPWPVVVADLNNDGKLDIATANFGASDLSVLLGNGAGSFGTANNFATGTRPYAIAVRDFSGDGIVDLATANYSSYDLSVLLGTGGGNFGPPTALTAGGRPNSVVFGDFNGDGKPDLVAGNYDTSNVSLLLGNGAGGFGAATNFAVAGNIIAVASGDFNSDGKLDVATANITSHNVSVLLGNGAGSFNPAVNLAVGTRPSSLAVGDLNHDGKLDIVTGNQTSNNVSVLLGDGSGGFSAATNFNVGNGPHSVTVGDFNLDGKQDIATANLNSNSIDVLLGTGTGSFGTATTFNVGTNPTSLAAGDFNSDGKSDLAVANSGANNVSVLLNTIPTVTLAAGTTPSETGPTNGTFTITLDQPAPTGGLTVNYNTTGSTAANPARYSFDQATSTNITAVTASTFTIAAGQTTATLAVKPVDDSILNPGETVKLNLTASSDYILGPTSGATVEFTGANYATAPTPQGSASGDFNGDGKQDIVTANRGSNNVSVLLGNGAGSFGAATNFAAGINPSQVKVGDFNGDGKQDIVVSNYSGGSGTISVLLGNGAGGFGTPTSVSVLGALALGTGDFNGDGKLDVAVGRYNAGVVSILLGDGSGGFGVATNYTVGTRPFSVAVADFNRDGKQDMAVTNQTSNNVSVLLGDGAGGFGTATNYNLGAGLLGIAAADFNSDGKQDIVVAKDNSSNISVLLGDGAGGFGAATNYTVGTNPYSVRAGDFNGDGKLDIAASNGGSSNLSVLLGNGAGSFGTATTFALGTNPGAVAVTDFNSDGKSDIAVTNWGSGNVSVLLSNNQPTTTLTITDNDNVEIDIQGNSTSIADGDTTPSLTDYTDFGSATVTTGNVTRTFTIANTGPDPLTLTGTPLVSITGANAADFSVTATPTATVGSSSQTTFEVTFTPSALGVRTADIAIGSNDSNENPYNFTIQGTGTSIPTVSNISKTGNEDNNITFAAADFTNGFSDADGDSLNKIKITSLPANGTLQLSGTNVTLNQEILLASIPNLTFTPTANYNGSSSFTWNASDGSNYATTDATANLTVNPINDAPSFSNAGNQTLTNWTTALQTVSGWANTFVFGPTNDENSQTVAGFLVSVTSGTDLFTALPAIANNGTLTYTPNGKPGTATVQVQLKDDGGTLNGGVDTSTAQTFNIIIPPPTVNLTVNTTTGTEAGTTAITLTATAQGAVFGNQTLNLALTGTASNADFSGTIPTQITIADGSNSGQVTLTIANDFIAEDSETATLTISNPSVGIALGTTTTQTITITDDDTAGYDITAISGDTSEFGSLATFDIKLTSQPTADVTLNFASSDTTEGTVIPSITFNSSNWNQYQTVTITGVDDLVADGDITYNITSTATSADPKYNNNNPNPVAVINTDNDIPGVTVIQTGGNTELTEGSITDTYTIQLNTLPTGNVQITATADAQTEISLDGVNFAPTQTLTFTIVNGTTPQTVTVRAIDDTTPEDYHSSSITHTISNSADTNYPTTMTVGGVNPHITDNDISYSLTGSSTTVTEGNSGSQQITYNITRTGAINEPSNVDFSFSGTAANTIDYNLVSITGTGVTTSGSTITFAPNATQSTITVEVLGDQIDEDNETLIFSLVNPTATGTPSLIGSPVTTTITDDDTAGITVNPTAGLTTTEAGGSSSFDVHLTSQPTANLTINLSSSNTAEGTIDKNSLTFTAANWNTPQTVTITGVDDLVDDGNISYNIVTAAATSTDAKYSGMNAADVAVTNINNDTAGITITPTSGLTTTEAGGTATFTVKLNSQPTANVSINLSSNKPAEGTIDKNSLTFTAANWNTPQTVTITGKDDLVDDGNISYNIITAAATSTDAKYNGINADDVAVTNIDNDTAGVTITPSGGNTQLTEGSITDTYTIALDTLPIGNVQITATADAQTQVSLDGVNFAASQTLTFTPTNGMTPRTVTVRAIDDNTTENIHSGSITNAITNSADANYPTTMALSGITTNITDNDISYSLTGGSPTITEGNSGTQQLTYNITRTGALNETSTVDFSFSGTATNIADYKLVSVTGTGVSTTNSTINFAPNATSATITVEIVGDQIDEDNESLILSLVNPTATGTATVIGSPITTTITDDDTAGFTITPTSLTTTEAGGNATFTVALNSQPTADVKINLSSDNTAEGTLDKPSLTFNAANWNSPQTVTVTGVDDFGDDGDILYNIITSVATSTDAKYNGINPVDVAVTNTDNDTAGVALSSTSVAAYEGGAGGSYTAVLTSKPTAPVTVNFNGGSQINPLTALTFNSNNWNVPQPVIITAIDDNIAEGLATEIISHTVTSADAKYNGVNVGTVAVSITDNDAAAAPVVQPLGRMDVRESGGEDVYKLFLTTQPTATVNVAIVTDGQTTANVPYLTFTTDDWNLPQLVRVSAVDDNVVEGFHTSNITFVASSADGFYQGLPISGIVANIADNDNVGLVESLPTPGSMVGTAADDNLVGSSGDDVINGRGGNNALDGGAGNDVLLGGAGADYITGGAGLDLLFGGQGEDYVDGGDDDDVIFAGMGSDRLYGGAGNDKLFGEQGNDYLCGDAGGDSLTGGLGRDAFAIGNGTGGMTLEMADVITDFVPGEDVFDLIPSLGFGDLSLVQNGADVVIQNRVTNEFLARLQGVDVPSLTQADFV